VRERRRYPRVQAMRTRRRWFSGLRNPGHHDLMHPVRDRAAARARRCGRVIGDRPYFQHAARTGLRVDDLQALYPEQRRRRIPGHDARGFLMSLTLVRPEIAGAAGSLTAATRPRLARPAQASGTRAGGPKPGAALPWTRVRPFSPGRRR
jgi:hypothetical protein